MKIGAFYAYTRQMWYPELDAFNFDPKIWAEYCCIILFIYLLFIALYQGFPTFLSRDPHISFRDPSYNFFFRLRPHYFHMKGQLCRNIRSWFLGGTQMVNSVLSTTTRWTNLSEGFIMMISCIQIFPFYDDFGINFGQLQKSPFHHWCTVYLVCILGGI